VWPALTSSVAHAVSSGDGQGKSHAAVLSTEAPMMEARLPVAFIPRRVDKAGLCKQKPSARPDPAVVECAAHQCMP
jgi:hypothetical protein